MNKFNGKGKFVQRLSEAFINYDIKVIKDPYDCDINMRLNSYPSYDYGVKVVRLDDVAFSNDIIHKKIYQKGLRKTKYAIKNANGIIYQSEVAKNMCEGVLKISSNNYCIIHNGINPSNKKLNKIDLPKGKNFIHACQKLFPQRRLDKLLKTWEIFIKDKKDAFLHIVHDKDEVYESIDFDKYKNIMVHDIMQQEELDNFLYSCDASISIKYQDSCPNFIVESLACGTPVITSNTNGYAEILSQPYLLIADIDPCFTYKKVQWERPPFTDKNRLIEQLDFIYNNEKLKFIFPEKIHINETAQNYIRFFESLLNKQKRPNPESFMRTWNTKIKNKLLSKFKLI